MNIATLISSIGAGAVGQALPSLSLSAASVPENSAPGTTIGVAVPMNASNPGAVSIVSQTLANAIVMTGDGITFAVGAAGGATGTLNAEVTPTFQVTFAYTDDDGVHQFTRTITITDVADGPTIVGAATSLEAMVGAPQVGVQVSGDLDTLFVSPTSQAMTYTVSHGSIGVGNAWTWTPSAAGPTTVSVTAEDADGQTLQIDFAVDVAAAAPVNNAPVAGNVTLEFLVPPPAVGAPDAFTAGQWSVADAGTNGDATITITALPADNGSAITALEYRLNGGAAVSLGGITTGAYGISGLTDGSATNVQVRAVNAAGAGLWSDTKSVTATGIPAAFTAGQWTLSDLTTGGDARIAISSLPSAAGSALTDLEAKVGAGAWTSLGGATTGNYDLLNAFTDGVPTNVLIRAVNVNGAGADSDTKSVTTTTADVTAPTLSSPTDAANGQTAATGSVSTNEGNGTLYWVVSTSSTAPSAAQVKAGQMHTGAAAADSGSQAVSGTGVQTLSPAPSGLTASTAYWIHFMHEDAAANQSSVASGDGFTTAASGITGHDTVHRVESTATAGSYNFTLPGITSGQIIHLPVKVLSDSNIQSPASWTVTLNGVAATPVVGIANASSGVFPAIGAFWVQANATGDLTLAITPSGACRACSVDARYLNGVNTTTPVVGTPSAPNSLNSDVTSLNSPNGYVPQAAGNVILDDICIKGGDITGLSASGADGSSVGETGSNATSDVEVGAAYIVATDTSAKTIAWSWTGADRVSSTVVEYQPA